MQIGKIYKTNILFAVIYFITVLLSTLLVSLLGEINLNNLMLRTVLCFFFSILMLFISIENYKNGKQFVNKKIKSKKKVEDKKMEKTLTIEGMMCGHCEARVKKALEALPEVKEAVVSHEAGTAVVTLESAVSDEALKEAVEAQDYKVISVQ